MYLKRVKIKDMISIKEVELDERSVMFVGKKGAGKTSILDSIRYALTNQSEREYLIRQGKEEGEVLIETDAGHTLKRKKREGKNDYKSFSKDGETIARPETILKEMFTELQLDPIKFLYKTPKEQNSEILDLIDFKWDMNYIMDQFGEIPEKIDYEQNILKVLNDIQAENGQYFMKRQDINREIRNKKAFIKEIADKIPDDYNYHKWKKYDIGEDYKKLTEAQENNTKIDNAKQFLDSVVEKEKNLLANKENGKLKANQEKDKIVYDLELKIQKLKSEISEIEKDCKKKEQEFEEGYEVALKNLQGTKERAKSRLQTQKVDVEEIKQDIETVKAYMEHIPSYDKALALEKEVDTLVEESKDLTNKIEKARELPGEILSQANIPIEGVTVKDGLALINGLPVSNLSDGEKLDLCVEIASTGVDKLKLILIDGCEKLDDTSKKELFESCKRKGLQVIATTTTNDSELDIIYL